MLRISSEVGADLVKISKYMFPILFGGLFLYADVRTSEALQQGNIVQAVEATRGMVWEALGTGLSYPSLNFIERQLRKFTQSLK